MTASPRTASPGIASPVDENEEPFRIDGYRILGEIGRGGMGVVYRAHQHRLNRLVAVKMILAGKLAGMEERVRFRLEGALLARLNHPNFVQVYEVGTLEVSPGTVQQYLVLEHVDGTTLRSEMALGPMSFRQAAARMLELSRAMEAAHAQGIVHRDLKPSNVLVAKDGMLKISDFGLAKELAGDGSLTPTGLTVGTPEYMAPEQAQGNHPIGPAADVYALGSILYEMLTGRTPFEGATAVEVIVKVLQESPAPATRLRRAIPRDLATICHKCLDKDPRARYLRATDLADDLACWLEDRPIRARPAGRIETTLKWARRHPLPALLLVFLVMTLLLGSAASTYFAVLASTRADETQKALENEAEARFASDRRAAELQLVAGEAAADAGEIDRGMFLMVRALELAPKRDEDLSRRIRLDLETWLPYLPRLRWWHNRPLSASPLFLDDEVVAIHDRDLTILDAETGRTKGTLTLPEGPLRAFGVGGRNACIGNETKDGPKLSVVDLKTGEPVGPSIADRSAVDLRAKQPGTLYELSFSNDEKLLARDLRGPWGSERRVWDVRTGREAGPPVTENGIAWSQLLRGTDGSAYWLFLRDPGSIDVVDVASGKSLGNGPGCLPADAERPAQRFPSRPLVQGWPAVRRRSSSGT